MGRAETSSPNVRLICLVAGRSSRSNDSSRMPRRAVHIEKLFSSNERKYSGSYDEWNVEFVDRYLAVSIDLLLSPSERLEFIHNIFHGEALRLYNGNVIGRAPDFPESMQMMKDQFNYASKQQQVNADLSSYYIAAYWEDPELRRRSHSRNWEPYRKASIALPHNLEER